MSKAEGTDDPSGPPDLRGTTVGRFVLESRLGAGATGEVYRATDTHLKRTVAIKRLRPGAQGQRLPGYGLLKEAQRASALNHPGIANVYDLVSRGDEMFLIMEYVDGPTLRERMAAGIGLEAFRHIALQCAEALSAAHQKGILHGDVKPANIMLTRDEQTVKLCDFGLARRISSTDSGGSVRTAGPPVLAGTPAYMAPEIVHELPSDDRADVFSLGVVFYEMLSGRNPFATDSIVRTLDLIRRFSPPPIDQMCPGVPESLARLVARMLEKDPDRRITAAGVVSELGRIQIPATVADKHARRLWFGTAGAAVVVLALVAAFAIFGRRGGPADSPAAVPLRIHLAVLPFAISGATDKTFFAQGLVDALIGGLSRLTVGRGLQVASVADLRARNVATPRDARDQLGANVAFMGSLAYAGNRVRVDARLVDTSSAKNLRSSSFEVDASNPQALRDDIVETAVVMMGLTLKAGDHDVLTIKETTKPGAYDYYLQARGYLLNFDRIESLDSAVAVFRKALEVDPRYAPVYAGLGQADRRRYELTRASVWVEPARAACEGALSIDSVLSESHACLGLVLNGTGAYEQAAGEFNRALEVDPTNDVLYLGLATAYERLNRPADAERTYQRAIVLRPHYWAAHNNLAAYYYRRAVYDLALTSFQQAIALAPDSFRGYSSLGAVHFMKNQTADAVAAFEKSLAIRPNYVAASNLGTLYFYEGQFARSAEVYRQALALDAGNYQVWSNMADALEFAGRSAESVTAHKRALALAEEGLRVNPRNVALHMAAADSYAALGNAERSQAALQQVLRAEPKDARTRFALGVDFERRRGDRDAALEWLGKAVASGQTWREIDRFPSLQQLRSDSRFQRLRNPGEAR